MIPQSQFYVNQLGINHALICLSRTYQIYYFDSRNQTFRIAASHQQEEAMFVLLVRASSSVYQHLAKKAKKGESICASGREVAVSHQRFWNDDYWYAGLIKQNNFGYVAVAIDIIDEQLRIWHSMCDWKRLCHIGVKWTRSWISLKWKSKPRGFFGYINFGIRPNLKQHLC